MTNKLFWLIGGLIFLAAVRILLYFYNTKFREKFLQNKKAIGNEQILGARDKQEDSFSTIRRDDKILAVLADGMGGLFSGKTASKVATKTFMEKFTKQYRFDSFNKFLLNTAHEINEKILNQVEDRRIGTTLVAAFLEKNKCYWISIGDSSLFFYKDGQLELINNKHLYKNHLKAKLRAGEITREEMLTHPRRETLTSYLGDPEFHKIEYSKTPLEFNPGEKLLLCSDGVTDALDDGEIENILAKNLHPMESSQLIIKAVKAKQFPEQDNATVVVLDYA
jgi:serine/threonine protein phosphatase PrpC